MTATLPPPPLDYEQRVPRYQDAEDLIDIGPDMFGRACRLSRDAADAWMQMRSAAERAGVRLLLISGFRSRDRQEEIVRKKIEAGLPMDTILRSVAYPGYSEHHTGRAVDLGSPDCAHLTEDFERTRQFEWLRNHAQEFGFRLSYPRANPRSVTYEPWHWMWWKGSPNPGGCVPREPAHDPR